MPQGVADAAVASIEDKDGNWLLDLAPRDAVGCKNRRRAVSPQRR